MKKENFFKGEDYKGEEFKALIPKYYPLKYQKYIQEETELLKSKLKGADKILEAGVGIGRLIPELAPIVKEFVGIDNANLMLKKSEEIARNFKNVKIIKGNLEELNKVLSGDYFEYSLCVWNTLGNVEDEVEVLKNLSEITAKSIFITVYLKGTLADRKDWYKTLGIGISKIDEEKEIFYSKSGLKSKSYNLADMTKIANNAGLKIKDSKILSGVILWAELVR